MNIRIRHGMMRIATWLLGFALPPTSQDKHQTTIHTSERKTEQMKLKDKTVIIDLDTLHLLTSAANSQAMYEEWYNDKRKQVEELTAQVADLKQKLSPKSED